MRQILLAATKQSRQVRPRCPQAKDHGKAGLGHVQAGTQEKKDAYGAEKDARKDAAKSEYHQQRA